MSKYKVKNYINLASPILGTKIYSYSDQFFGAASRMLNENSPIFKEHVYDKHGKWMDGWETRRKRIKGNDFCIIKLGKPGKVSVVEIDTSFLMATNQNMLHWMFAFLIIINLSGKIF